MVVFIILIKYTHIYFTLPSNYGLPFTMCASKGFVIVVWLQTAAIHDVGVDGFTLSLQVETMSFYLSFSRWKTYMYDQDFSNITTGSGANQGAKWILQKCDMKTWNLQGTYTESGLFSEVAIILCQVAKPLKRSTFAYSLDFSMRENKKMSFSQTSQGSWTFFVGKPHKFQTNYYSEQSIF